MLICDDHSVARNGARTAIDPQPDLTVVGEAKDGEEAVRLYAQLLPDVVLMDLEMPKKSGKEAMRAIIQSDQNARVLVFTAHEHDADIFPAIEIGAAGYLLKYAADAEICRAVRNVAEGHVPLSPEANRRLVEQFRRDQNVLTPREAEVLQLTCWLYNDAEIAKHLHISARTLANTFSNAYAKLDVNSRVGAVVVALRRGVIRLWEAPSEDRSRERA